MKKRGTKNILARKKFSLELRLLTYECYSHRKTCPIFSLSQWILVEIFRDYREITNFKNDQLMKS